jgi:membrane protease YdiL (CAAX protease family)
MSTITGNLSTASRISDYVRRHPVTAYFILAYTGTWLLILPLVLDNFALINLSDGATMLFFILSSIAGPNLAAFYVTDVLEGKAGMGRLFRRIFQVRAGLIWYAVALFSFLAIWLVAYSFLYSGAPIANLVANPSLLLTVFLPSMLFGLLIPSIGEEPGWRGFALPHLQKLYGPVIGTLVLGTLHGCGTFPHFSRPSWDPSL